MAFTTNEVREFLATDRKLHMLIVEGRADAQIWHYIVPINERENCVVYSVDEIELPVGFEGNRGAALEFANTCLEWAEGERVKFFLDADNDHQLGIAPPANVTFTDYRDLEAYALNDPVFEHLCKVGAGLNDEGWQKAKRVSRDLLRPVGILRIASARQNYKLPFRKTFEDGSIKRFFRKRGKIISLVEESLYDALIRNAARPQLDKVLIRISYAEEHEFCDGALDCDVIHGKDFVAFLAWYLKSPLGMADGLIRLAIGANVSHVRKAPNIDKTRKWLLAA